LGDRAGRQLQVLGQTRVSDDSDPPPLRDEGVVRDQDHGPLLDLHGDPLRLWVCALLPLLLPLLPGSRMTVLVLDRGLLGDALARAGDEDVIVVDLHAARLEELERETRDPRAFYLIGEPAILPLPDG